MIRHIYRAEDCRECPNWPPDAFAIAAYLLKLSGLHSRVLAGSWPPRGESVAEWTKTASEVGELWQDNLVCPEEVLECWKAIWKKKIRHLTVASLRTAFDAEQTSNAENPRSSHKQSQMRAKNLAVALIELLAYADEACTGASQTLFDDETDLREESSFAYRANRQLIEHNSFAIAIDSGVATVLPKIQTAQIGFNLRSLSHNVALWTQPEVKPIWQPVSPFLRREPVISIGDPDLNKSINLLLLPWPFAIDPQQFRASMTDGLASGHGCFTYTPQQTDPWNLFAKISAMIEQCERKAGPVDCVVLPELALRADDYSELLRKTHLSALETGLDPSGLIAGIAKGKANSVAVSLHTGGVPGLVDDAAVYQNKHHRWKLDRDQIVQYGLGGALGTDIQWWEHIDISQRRVIFHQAGRRLTLSVLICEDLARQDPVAQLIRTVGPNLVLALLMDGPQVRGRWADRYASVLADDPGSSVLSFTSVGMVSRCASPTDQFKRPTKGCQRCVIGLWRDSETNTHELELEEGSCGLLLTLNAKPERQFTADGREAHTVQRDVIVLSAVHQVTGPRSIEVE